MGRIPRASAKPKKRSTPTRTKKIEHDPGPGTPRLVDVHFGRRVRLRRILLGLSQEALGNAVGVTFQQIQKYEIGSNRVSASRLCEFAQILNVPIDLFFEEMPENTVATGGRRLRLPKGWSHSITRDDIMTQRETLQIVRHYYAIRDPKLRKALGELIHRAAMATDPKQPPPFDPPCHGAINCNRQSSAMLTGEIEPTAGWFGDEESGSVMDGEYTADVRSRGDLLVTYKAQGPGDVSPGPCFDWWSRGESNP